MAELLRREIALVCAPEHAFRVFTDNVDLWWPRGHRRFRDGALRFDGGRLIDRGPDGTEWTMAEVLDHVPPTRLHLAWFPGSPNAPTDVEVGFVGGLGGTQVTIIHRPLSPASAEIWPARVATFWTGWEAVGDALARWIEQHEEE